MRLYWTEQEREKILNNKRVGETWVAFAKREIPYRTGVACFKYARKHFKIENKGAFLKCNSLIFNSRKTSSHSGKIYSYSSIQIHTGQSDPPLLSYIQKQKSLYPDKFLIYSQNSI